MNESPEATRKGPAARRVDARRVAGLFLTAVLTLAITSVVLERVPGQLFQSTSEQAEPRDDLADSYGMEPSQLYELYAEELENTLEREQAQSEFVESTESDDDPDAGGMSRSSPTKVKISKIEVDAEVTPTGKEADEFSDALIPDDDAVGWYEPGPSPGEAGSSVLLGKANAKDDEDEPAGLAKLDRLRIGDEIEVERKDGEVVKFVVDTMRVCPTDFPTSLPADPTTDPRLHLLTCGEDEGGVIVSGTLATDLKEEEEKEKESAEESASDGDEAKEEVTQQAGTEEEKAKPESGD